MIAVIGGSGVYNSSFSKDSQQQIVETPYGSVFYRTGYINNSPAYFMARHGSQHSIAPHLINYRANIWALKKLGVQKIFSTAAVGSLCEDIPPGSFIVIDDFMDFTNGREQTFFAGGSDSKLLHMDVSQPYCPNLRKIILDSIRAHGQIAVEHGTYVCTQGPRYESKAEIRMFQKLDGHVVGMTNVPECVLAREAEMCYATICLVTNYAAGIAKHSLTFKEVGDLMEEKKILLDSILETSLKAAITAPVSCECGHAAHEVGGFKLS